MTLGFIGTGTLTTAIVAGLRACGNSEKIVLSPRSEEMSKLLAERFTDVHRAASNTTVAREADILFLAVRPTQVEMAVKGIHFRPDQLVISFVTGLSVPDLARLAPHSTVGRVLPLPMIAQGKGPIVCFPRHGRAVELFSQLGNVLCAESEHELQAFGRVSAFMSSYFELQQSLIAYLEQQSIAREHASQYVCSMLLGLADTGARTPEQELPGLALHHETKGGLNERVRRHLQSEDWFRKPGRAFDLLQQLQRNSLE